MDDFKDRSQFRIGDLMVVPASLVVVRNGQEIKFEPRWMQVLVMLAEHAGETLSTERLLIEVWGSTIYGDSPVSKTVSYIRKNIGDDSRKPRYIETVSKVGYKLIELVSLPENYRRMPTERWTKGSPYVGLSAFDADHASVFCGRSRIVADLLRAMRVQIENQRRFVLIVGASGCGKTSLLRAGAIPLLTKPDGFDGLRALSVTTCDLAANGRDPLISLTAALAAWTLDDRPVFPPQTPDQLKALLIKTPEMIAGFVIEAFQRHFKNDLDEHRFAHLLLTVDHAEALVATTDIDANARDAFAGVLQALCACPHVLVTMITRGDFYLKLIETLPALAECKAGDGHLDVIAPRYGEIGEIIRSPAWKADLSFETDPETRTRLDDALRDAALSQHTLQTLYERRNDQRQLTFAAYNDIGGLEGAIAHRAEEVFATLPESEQKCLDAVLAKLIVIHPDNDVVSARRTEVDAFDKNAFALIDTFIKARLFVSDGHNGHRVFGVIHEALLRRWPRAVEWSQDNRRLLQAKARLQRAAARWVEEGRRDDHLLNPGRPLAEAREVERCFADEITDDERSLLRASERMSRKKIILKRVAVSVLAVLATVSTTLAIVATHANIAAERNRKEALDLIGYMLVELADQLRPTASAHPLDSISTYALNLLERQPVEKMESEDLINYSRALRTRGEVMSMEGKDAQALSLFRRADEMAGRAVKAEHDIASALSESGQTAYWIGFQLRKKGDYKNAMTEWRRYQVSSEQLLKINGANPDWQMENLLASTNLGTLELFDSGCAAALEKLETSLSKMERIIASSHEKDSWKYHWIVTRSWVSRCHAEDGRVADASAGYASEIKDLHGLLGKNPASTEWIHQLSSLLHLAAMQSVNGGRIDDAESKIAEAIELLAIVTRLQPSNPGWKRNLVSALARGGEIAQLRGDTVTALSRLRSAKTIVDSERPRGLGTSWKRLDATLRFRLGRFHRSADSDTIMATAIEDLAALAKAHPDDEYIISALSEALVSRGTLRSENGHITDARIDWSTANSVLSEVAKRSQDPDILAPWINSSLTLDQRELADTHIRRLVDSGYRHPEFIRIEAATRRGHHD